MVLSDRQRRSLLRFDAGGRLLGEWGPKLSGSEVVLGEPAGLAPRADHISVLDRGNPSILRLDAATGQPLLVISLEPFGPYGLNGLAEDASGNLLAADTGRNRLLVFGPSGRFLREVGRGGTGLGEFTQPMALAFAPDGGLFVADWENARVERWETAGWTATGAWATGYRPFGVAVGKLGRVFVPNSDRGLIQVFTPDGTLLGELGGASSPALPLRAPRQLAFGPPQGNGLYVLGQEGVVRLDLGDTPPPPQGGGSGSEVESAALAALATVAGLGALLIAWRQRRPARAVGSIGSVGSVGVGPVVGAAAGRPAGLHAVDGAEGQQQQAQANQDGVLADQAEREQQAGQQHHQAE
jgi:DNA-binding beta-propeller fold protein YncE